MKLQWNLTLYRPRCMFVWNMQMFQMQVGSTMQHCLIPKLWTCNLALLGNHTETN